MDALDVKIVYAMGLRPYAKQAKDPQVLKPARIAQSVGVTPETVKARLRGLEAAGVLRGYKTIPNLRHLGLTGEAHYFRFPEDEAKDEKLPELASLEGLLEIHDFLGRGLCVDFASRDDADRDGKLAAISATLGDDRPRKFYDRDMPAVTRELSALDWTILRSLREDARKSPDLIADELGVSGRTVRRRYERMAAEGSFFVVPVVDPSRAEGLFVFNLHFFLDAATMRETTRRILDVYSGNYLYAYVPATPELGSLDLVAVARSTNEVDRMRREGAAIAGVAQAESWFFRGLHDYSGWVDKAVDAKIEAAATRATDDAETVP